MTPLIDMLVHSASIRQLCLRVLIIVHHIHFSTIENTRHDISDTNFHRWDELDSLLTGPEFVGLQEVVLTLDFLVVPELFKEIPDLEQTMKRDTEHHFLTSFPAIQRSKNITFRPSFKFSRTA